MFNTELDKNVATQKQKRKQYSAYSVFVHIARVIIIMTHIIPINRLMVHWHLHCIHTWWNVVCRFIMIPKQLQKSGFNARTFDTSAIVSGRDKNEEQSKRAEEREWQMLRKLSKFNKYIFGWFGYTKNAIDVTFTIHIKWKVNVEDYQRLHNVCRSSFNKMSQ